MVGKGHFGVGNNAVYSLMRGYVMKGGGSLNAEGYKDPTAEKAISDIVISEREKSVARAMKAKEFLTSIRAANRRLASLEKERDQLKQDICSLQAINYDSVVVTGGRIVDTSDKIAKLEGVLIRVNEAWDRLIDLREEGRRLIAKLPDEKQREVLENRYIFCLSWKIIAKEWRCSDGEYGCSWQNLHKLHKKALKKLGGLL